MPKQIGDIHSRLRKNTHSPSCAVENSPLVKKDRSNLESKTKYKRVKTASGKEHHLGKKRGYMSKSEMANSKTGGGGSDGPLQDKEFYGEERVANLSPLEEGRGALRKCHCFGEGSCSSSETKSELKRT